MNREIEGLPNSARRSKYFETYMNKPPPIFDVPYDVDTERFAGHEIYDRHAACQHWGFDPARKRILFVGRLVAVKGLDVLLEAFAKVVLDRPNWDLVIAGQGPLETELRSSLPKSLGNRIRWTGFIDHDLLPRLYAACDAFVLPSRSEPWGVVLTEAVASGLPFVATDVVGAALEIRRHGREAGLLVPPDDPHGLSHALQAMTEPAALRRHSVQATEAFRLWRSHSDPVTGFADAIRHTLS